MVNSIFFSNSKIISVTMVMVKICKKRASMFSGFFSFSFEVKLSKDYVTLMRLGREARHVNVRA